MRRHHARLPAVWILCLGVAVTTRAGMSEEVETMQLFDFEGAFALQEMEARDVDISLVPSGGGQALRIASGHAVDWPGITLSPPGDRWDVSGYRQLTMDVTNTGSNEVSVGLRVDNPGGDGNVNCVQVIESLAPGDRVSIVAELCQTPWRLTPPLELVGMRAAPGQTRIDPADVVQLIVFVPQPRQSHEFVIDNIRAEGELEELDSATFLPFIDELGQYIHRDWPGKIQGPGDLDRRRSAEEEDLGSHPGPVARNGYGGWMAGPQLEATGLFRVEQYGGKWWLVDPEGRLFWSHGVDCVTWWGQTGITDREAYFRGLPDSDSPLAAFYGEGTWAPHGYYQDKVPYTTFSHQNANLRRKYGEEWQGHHTDVTHRRLRSWGMNTVANWSASQIYLARRTPYVATVHFSAPKLAGSTGYWGQFHDVFDAGFRSGLRRALAEKSAEAGDPWCIGFFVDNELGWGDEVSLSLATLASPADQAAKLAFSRDLRERYGTIDNLNGAWGTQHESWEAFLESPAAPNRDRAWEDLTAFYTRTAETYFRTIREELAAAAPDQLYLGCRFAWVNERAARAAFRYCDVVSYNRYAYSVEGLAIPGGADRPVIIGEFHFGALDRGMFHTGLKAARDQEHRARLYRDYVRGALAHPLIVGTHWFQYQDQSTTGRGDGENYQIGFVDICDTPYPEIVSASREVGYGLYDYRLGADAKGGRRAGED
ncbi:beta-galactosidase [Candidatus Latescibacterota bacterium]